ncbi:MAG: hypothetical protein ACK5OC_08375, partial [Pirellula sp.]
NAPNHTPKTNAGQQKTACPLCVLFFYCCGEDKRNALELLWASIERDAEQFTPPAWHAQVLADLGVSALGSLMFSDNSQNSLTKCENVGSSSQTVPDTCLIPFGCPRFQCQSIARKDL